MNRTLFFTIQKFILAPMIDNAQQFTTILVDDESSNLELLSYYIEKYCPKLKITRQISTLKEAIKVLSSTQPNVLFLDIVLDEGDAFDVLEAIDYSKTQVIFCTAYDKYAIKAFRYHVADYLLKPIEIKELVDTVQNVIDRMQSQDTPQQNNIEKIQGDLQKVAESSKVLKVEGKRGTQFVRFGDVVFCEVIPQSKSEIHFTNGESVVVNYNNVELFRKLNSPMFFKISRFHLINIYELKSVEKEHGLHCFMSNMARLPISRLAYNSLMEHMEKEIKNCP